MGQGNPVYDFIGTGGCMTAMLGPNPPTLCSANRTYTFGTFLAVLQAKWTTPADNMAANRCRFTCDGGVCEVRGEDALPVELLDFSIDEYSDPETDGNPKSDDGAPDAESSP